MGGKCPHRKVSKRRYSHKSNRRAKFLVKGDDAVYDTLKKVETGEAKPLPVDEDLPGMGQYYCFHCDRYFATVTVRDDHFKTKRHKKRAKKKIDAYGSPWGLQRVISNMNPKQKSDVEDIGFGGLLTLKLTTFNQAMEPFLLSSYSGRSRLFCVKETMKVVLTPYDVRDVFMLPCHTGKEVVRANLQTKDKPFAPLVHAWMDKFGVAKGKELSAERLASEMLDLEDGGDDFKRYFVLYAMGTLLAPTPHKSVDLHLVPSLEDVGEISQIDWCSYILNEIDDGVTKWRNKGLKNVSGCMLFLQLVYFHRLGWRSIKAPTDLPLIQHWTSDELSRRMNEEISAACEAGGSYGMGEWDGVTYPVSKHLAVNKHMQVPKPGVMALPASSARNVSYRLPDDLLTDEEIRKLAKNECEEECLLLKRDQELLGRVTLERVEKLKTKMERVKDTKEKAPNDGSGDEEMTLTQALNDPEVLKEIDKLVLKVIAASEAAREIEMPSFDLGIGEVGTKALPPNIYKLRGDRPYGKVTQVFERKKIRKE